jgi:hypothetical protein
MMICNDSNFQNLTRLKRGNMMVDKSVMAPVMSEPSLPFCVLCDWQKRSQAALGVSPEELERAKERSRDEDIPVLGLLFPMTGFALSAALRRWNTNSAIVSKRS